MNLIGKTVTTADGRTWRVVACIVRLERHASELPAWVGSQAVPVIETRTVDLSGVTICEEVSP